MFLVASEAVRLAALHSEIKLCFSAFVTQGGLVGSCLLPDLDNSDLRSNFVLYWEPLAWNCASILKSMDFKRSPCRVC